MAESSVIGIIGAGTMGAGIAQVAATSGWRVLLMDVDEATVGAAIDGVCRRLDRMVDTGRLSPQQRRAAADNLESLSGPQSLASCALILEAVVEDFDTKINVLRPDPADARPDAIAAGRPSVRPRPLSSSCCRHSHSRKRYARWPA